MPATAANVIRPSLWNPQVEPFADPIFFTKDQLHLGTNLRYYGRLNPGALFTVTHIKSWRRSSRGNYYAIRAEVASRLDDDITLLCREPGKRPDIRKMRFGYLSYSAIWRIEE